MAGRCTEVVRGPKSHVILTNELAICILLAALQIDRKRRSKIHPVLSGLKHRHVRSEH